MNHRKKKFLLVIATAVLATIWLAACDLREEEPAVERPDFSQAARTYAAGVHSAYLTSLVSAQALDASIDAFLADPSEETLGAARAAWIVAREDYGPTEVFRFYGGPIDNEETKRGS